MTSQSTLLRKIISAFQFAGAYFISFVLIAFAISKFFNAQFQSSLMRNFKFITTVAICL
jgi:hypothetical protein